MYAIEFFILLVIIGCYVAFCLIKYFINDHKLNVKLVIENRNAEELLDIYERIYLDKEDDQMHQLAQWRELALQNCRARRDLREDIKKEGNIAFIQEYRDQSRASDKLR